MKSFMFAIDRGQGGLIRLLFLYFVDFEFHLIHCQPSIIYSIIGTVVQMAKNESFKEDKGENDKQ